MAIITTGVSLLVVRFDLLSNPAEPRGRLGNRELLLRENFTRGDPGQVNNTVFLFTAVQGCQTQPRESEW